MSCDTRNDRLRRQGPIVAVGAGLVALTWIVFWQVRQFEFVNLDDGVYITDNPYVSTGLSWENVAWAFTTGATANWHPLTWLSLMFDVQFFGLNSGALHLTSLCFHTANVVLLYGILRSLTGSLWRSALVSALFAIHPLHVESVAWVSERKDVLSTFFGFMAIWCYGRFAKSESRTWFVACGLLWIGSLLAKQMLVTLPFVLLLLDYWPLGRFGGGKMRARGLVIEKLPFLAVTILFCAIAFLVQQRGGAVRNLDSFPLASRMANATVAYVLYLARTIWPQHLAAYYPHPRGGIPVWQIVAAAGLLVALTALAWRWSRRHPYCMIGWLWYLGTLVPVIGLVQIGNQQMADRYTYLPLIGIFLALAWMLPARAPSASWRASIVPIAAGAVVVLLAFVASRQASTWHDSERLYTHAIAVTGSNSFAETSLGYVLFLKERHDEAFEHYQRALQVDPRNVTALNSLGILMLKLGKREQALEFHNRALAVDPHDTTTLRQIGRVLFESGRTDEALEQLARAIQIDPLDSDAHENRGNIYRAIGKPNEALEEFRTAAQINPRSALAFNNVGAVLADLGRVDEALPNYRRAIRLDPRFAPAHANLAVVLHGKGDFSGAVAHLERAYELDPSNDVVRKNLAAELVNVGTERAGQDMLELAIDDFRDAVRLDPALFEANYRLALALGQKRRFEEAAGFFGKALALAPDVPQVHIDYGNVLHELGRRDESLEQVHEALRLQPDFPAAKVLLERWGQ